MCIYMYVLVYVRRAESYLTEPEEMRHDQQTVFSARIVRIMPNRPSKHFRECIVNVIIVLLMSYEREKERENINKILTNHTFQHSV